MGTLQSNFSRLPNIESLKICRTITTYEMATLSADDIASNSQDLAYFHRAIFKKGSDHKVLASCVSFATQDRVPPGSLYNVGVLVVVILIL